MSVEKIEILVPEAREKFQKWIGERGGVQVWKNINMSNPDGGDTYTPARTEMGGDYDKPHWSLEKGETITDVGRFRFATEIAEVKRVRIAVRMGSQGFSLKLTDGSTRRVRKACAKVKEQYGKEPTYHFEDDECVIEVPYFEDEVKPRTAPVVNKPRNP